MTSAPPSSAPAVAGVEHAVVTARINEYFRTAPNRSYCKEAYELTEREWEVLREGAARTERLLAALRQYGCHVHNGTDKLCASMVHSKYPCDCGLDALIAELAKDQQP